MKWPCHVPANVLVAAGLSKRYGATAAVDGVDLRLEPGRIVGLVGNNGAGKTTTLKMLAGVLEPTAGSCRVDGRPTLEPAARARLGFLPEDSPLYEDQTPLAYLTFFGALYGLPARESRRRGESWLRALRLGEEHWRKPIGDLSKGSARKVAIARALLHEPAVLILDEPASGLDPQTRRELDEVLLALRGQGKAVLLSAHNLRQVEELCDEILILHAGRVAARGTLAELRRHWGEARYRLHATVAFPGSRPAGAAHAAEFAALREAEAAMEAVRAAGGSVLELESVPPPLEEILRRAAGG